MKAKLNTQERLYAELQTRNKATLFDALDTARIASVVVSFDGSSPPNGG